MLCLPQGVEPEEFPLLLQSLKTDSPIKDLYCNPNKKLYRGKIPCFTILTNLFSPVSSSDGFVLCLVTQIWWITLWAHTPFSWPRKWWTKSFLSGILKITGSIHIYR